VSRSNWYAPCGKNRPMSHWTTCCGRWRAKTERAH